MQANLQTTIPFLSTIHKTNIIISAFWWSFYKRRQYIYCMQSIMGKEFTYRNSRLRTEYLCNRNHFHMCSIAESRNRPQLENTAEMYLLSTLCSFESGRGLKEDIERSKTLRRRSTCHIYNYGAYVHTLLQQDSNCGQTHWLSGVYSQRGCSHYHCILHP